MTQDKLNEFKAKTDDLGNKIASCMSSLPTPADPNKISQDDIAKMQMSTNYITAQVGAYQAQLQMLRVEYERLQFIDNFVNLTSVPNNS